MNEDLSSLQIKPIRNNKFAHWFQEVKYNGQTLSNEERQDLANTLDETIEQYSQGFASDISNNSICDDFRLDNSDGHYGS